MHADGTWRAGPHGHDTCEDGRHDSHVPTGVRSCAVEALAVGDAVVGRMQAWNVVAVDVPPVDWNAPTRAGTLAVTLAHPDDANTTTVRRFRRGTYVRVIAR